MEPVKNIAAQVTSAFRYWKVKVYLNTGTDQTDTPRVYDITLSQGSSSIALYEQELPTDLNTIGLWHLNETSAGTGQPLMMFLEIITMVLALELVLLVANLEMPEILMVQLIISISLIVILLEVYLKVLLLKLGLIELELLEEEIRS